MIKAIRGLMLAPVLLVAACAGSDESPKDDGEHVFSTQQKALERAKETSDLLEEAAKRQKKRLEEQR